MRTSCWKVEGEIKLRFSLETAAGNVYLHCEVHLCDPASEDDCSCDAAAAAAEDSAAAEGGAARRRRAIAAETQKPRATLKVGPISVQPWNKPNPD